MSSRGPTLSEFSFGAHLPLRRCDLLSFPFYFQAISEEVHDMLGRGDIFTYNPADENLDFWTYPKPIQNVYFENYIEAFDDVIKRYNLDLLKYTTLDKIELLRSRIFLNQAIKISKNGNVNLGVHFLRQGTRLKFVLKNWKYYGRYVKSLLD